MRAARRGGGRPAAASSGRDPQRTCVGCRRVRPQGSLLRFARTREGFVEPDPGHRGGGRGAYLCPDESCLTEAVRRGRWTQLFRRPAVLRPETIEGVRALLGAGRETENPPEAEIGAGVPSYAGGDAGGPPAVRLGRGPGVPVEGGW